MHPIEISRPIHHAGWVYEEKVDGWRMVALKSVRPFIVLDGRGGLTMAARHYETLSDEALQQTALTSANEREAVLSEVLFRTRDALNAEMRAANTLTTKISNLNQALLWYTIALAVMAAFQFGAWIRDLIR